MSDELRQRVATLERAVTDGETDCEALAAQALDADHLATLEDTVTDLEDRVAELEATTQALRGYVGNVRSVNRDVEQQAETALARVESLESASSAHSGPTNAIDDAEATTDTSSPGRTERRDRTDAGPGHTGATQTDVEASQREISKGHRASTQTDPDAGGRCRTCGQATDGGSIEGHQMDRERTDGTREPAQPPDSDADTFAPTEDSDRDGPVERLRALL